MEKRDWKKRTLASTIEEVVLGNVAQYLERRDINEFLKDREYSVPNIKEAVNLIYETVSKGEKIKVIGDYDVDGLMATSISYIFLSSIGAKVSVRIPRRISEGYGLNEKIVDEVDEGLIITVDNGIAAHAAIDKAKKKGIKVLLTDHHLPVVNEESGEVILPNADVIVNAHIRDNGFKEYCGAAVAYKIAEAYLGKGNELLKKLLPYAAIATVADVVPLYSENRSIVKKGLRLINKGEVTSGLKQLLFNLYMTGHVSASDIAFKIGPMLNAPGRLEDAGGLRILEVFAVDKKRDKESTQLENIKTLNEKRKSLVENWVAVADKQIAESDKKAPIFVLFDGVQEGIIGVIASSLVEKYSMPVFACANVDNGLIKCSARSVDSVHMKNLLDKNRGFLLKYGGHAKAAGLSLNRSNFEGFKKACKEDLKDFCSDKTAYYDLEIGLEEVKNVSEILKKYAPYGEGNPAPKFLIKNIQVKSVNKLKDAHVKLTTDHVDILGFGQLQEYKEAGYPQDIDVLCTVDTAWFKNVESAQLMMEDFIPLSKAAQEEIPTLEQLINDNKKKQEESISEQRRE